MYVNPFWAGVATTIFVELIGLVAIALAMASKDNRNNGGY